MTGNSKSLRVGAKRQTPTQTKLEAMIETLNYHEIGDIIDLINGFECSKCVKNHTGYGEPEPCDDRSQHRHELIEKLRGIMEENHDQFHQDLLALIDEKKVDVVEFHGTNQGQPVIKAEVFKAVPVSVFGKGDE